MSSASAKSASIASGPALNVEVVSVVSPSFSSKRPCSTPTRAGAWVTFGKKPSRTSSAVAVPMVVVLPSAAVVSEDSSSPPQAATTKDRASIIAMAIASGWVVDLSSLEPPKLTNAVAFVDKKAGAVKLSHWVSGNNLSCHPPTGKGP